jgi:hypothetical protein
MVGWKLADWEIALRMVGKQKARAHQRFTQPVSTPPDNAPSALGWPGRIRAADAGALVHASCCWSGAHVASVGVARCVPAETQRLVCSTGPRVAARRRQRLRRRVRAVRRAGGAARHAAPLRARAASFRSVCGGPSPIRPLLQPRIPRRGLPAAQHGARALHHARRYRSQRIPAPHGAVLAASGRLPWGRLAGRAGAGGCGGGGGQGLSAGGVGGARRVRPCAGVGA